MAERTSNARAPTVDVAAYAAALATAAPPLTADQLDALGQIIQTAVPPPKEPLKRVRQRPKQATQLKLPYNTKRRPPVPTRN
jgi:hypothetical protein